MRTNYEAIQRQIQQARLQRSVYLAELISSGIVAAWHGINYAADVVLSVSRAKNPKGVFTFDA